MADIFEIDKTPQDRIDAAIYELVVSGGEIGYSRGLLGDMLGDRNFDGSNRRDPLNDAAINRFKDTNVILELQRERNPHIRTYQSPVPVVSIVGATIDTRVIEFGEPLLHEVDYHLAVQMDVFDEFEGISANSIAHDFMSEFVRRVRLFDWGETGIDYVTSNLGNRTFNEDGRLRYSTRVMIEFKYYICP